MNTYDRGSAIVVEVTFKRYVPFSNSSSYYDVTSPKVTITDPDGNVVVDAQDLTKSETGKYYYFCQTLVTWSIGIYEIKATSSEGSLNDVTVDETGFVLK